MPPESWTTPKDRTASNVVATRRRAQRILAAGERAGRPGTIYGHRKSYCVVWEPASPARER